MLILTRKATEDVLLTINGHTITVRVVETRGNGKVRLGFEAPPGVTIHRREIHDAINSTHAATDG